jgi:hypothetical protein
MLSNRHGAGWLQMSEGNRRFPRALSTLASKRNASYSKKAGERLRKVIQQALKVFKLVSYASAHCVYISTSDDLDEAFF